MFELTVRVTDSSGASADRPFTVVVAVDDGVPLNVAAQANGGVASASSTYGGAYPLAAVNNGDRRGLGYGSGGVWVDGTKNGWPDWVQVTFAGPRSITEVNVFTVQDAYASPAEPTETMTFGKYGVTAFEVQYWTGSAWAGIPGGSVSGNNRVWRRFAFAPITTDRVRVVISAGLAGYTRVAEVEALGTP